MSEIKVVILSGGLNGISWLWRLSDIESFAYRQNQWSSKLSLCATSPQVAVTISGGGGARLPDKRDECHLQRSDTCMCNTCRLCFNSSSACLIKLAHHLLLMVFDELNMLQTSLTLRNIFSVSLLTLIMCFSWCETVNSIKGRLKAALFKRLLSFLIRITSHQEPKKANLQQFTFYISNATHPLAVFKVKRFK